MNTCSVRTAAAAALLSLAVFSAPASALTPVFDNMPAPYTLGGAPAIASFTVGSQFTGFSADETVGWSFEVAGPGVIVSSLGWWDALPDDPLAATHEVGIWDTAGTLLASATVQVNDPLTGGFRYAELGATLTLAPGTYIIGGRDLVSDGDSYSSTNSALVMGAGITFLQAARSDIGLGFSFPNILNNNPGGRFGPNFIYTPVPEPGTVLMAAFGLAAVGAAVARRRATASRP